MACSSAVPCALAPTFSRATSATRASPSSLRAPTLLKGTPLLGGKLAQSAQGATMLRSRPASIARAQAMSTSAPVVGDAVSGADRSIGCDRPDQLKTVTEAILDEKWLELHGKSNWAGLLPIKGKSGDPGKIDPELKETIIKYGEMAQLTYDSVDLYEWSRYRSQNRFTKKIGKDQLVPGELFGTHLQRTSHFQYLLPEEYEAIAYMYVNEKTQVFQAIKKPMGQDITEDVWMGYIAYSKTNRDIVVAWRGTLQPAEWVADAEVALVSYTPYHHAEHKDPPQTSLEPKDPPPKSRLEDPPPTSELEEPLTSERQKVDDKRMYAVLAGVSAALWGGFSAWLIAFPLYHIFRFFEAESFLGAAYVAAFSAAAALPIYKVVFEDRKFPLFNLSFGDKQAGHNIAKDEKPGGVKIGGAVKQEAAKIGGAVKQEADKIGGNGKAEADKVGGADESEEDKKVGMKLLVLGYLALAGITTALANRVTSPDHFCIVDSFMFALFVLLPTGLTAANEAGECAGEGPQVHEGFWELYDPTGDKEKLLPKMTGKAPRQVVHDTLEQLLREHPDTRTISVTGHSLGGALAVLSAYDIVESGCNVGADGKTRIQVACFAFEAPRVGNLTFKDSFEKKLTEGKKLAAIRVVNKPDIVTQVPKAFFLQNVYYVLAALMNNDWGVNIINWVEGIGYWLKLPSAFQHPGHELVHDSRDVDYLKKMTSWNPLDNIDAVGNYHNLEVNLHMVSGYRSSELFTRDFAMCNKSADVIDPRAGVPPNWFKAVIRDWVFEVNGKGAIIEPYNPDLDPQDREDEKREIGQGPVASAGSNIGKCMPLEKNYFKHNLKNYEPPKNEVWEFLMQKLKKQLKALNVAGSAKR